MDKETTESVVHLEVPVEFGTIIDGITEEYGEDGLATFVKMAIESMEDCDLIDETIKDIISTLGGK